MDLMTTAKFYGSEISKAEDFNHGANAALNILHPLFQGLFADVVNSFILSGFTVTQATPASRNVIIHPGVLFSRVENKLLHVGENVVVSVPASSASDRIDLLEVKYSTSAIDTASRAFKDPATGAITYNNVFTKTKASIEARVVPGTAGSGVAPNVEAGWTKLAEILVPANSTQVITANIKPATAEEDAAENTDWTAQKTLTFCLGSAEAMKNTLLAHIRNNVTSSNTVHGIRQGSGNGFDADKVDGIEAARILYGDSATGSTLVTDANAITKPGLYRIGSTGANIPVAQHGVIYANFYDTQGGVQLYQGFSDGTVYIRVRSSSAWRDWFKLWNSANDGSGSGMDTDLVRGVTPGSRGLNYLAANATANIAPYILADLKTVDGPGSGLDADTVTDCGIGAVSKNISETNLGALEKNGFFNGDRLSESPLDSVQEHVIISAGSAANRIQFAQNIHNPEDLFIRLINYINVRYWHKIWTDGNDGPGSGLDADLLDGLHASSIKQAVTGIQVLTADPSSPANGTIWLRSNV